MNCLIEPVKNFAALKFSCLCAAQDHYFDVVTNVVGLVAAVLGDKFFWWIDPVGAVLLAVYTIVNWSGTVYENAGLPSRFLNTSFSPFFKPALFVFFLSK